MKIDNIKKIEIIKWNNHIIIKKKRDVNKLELKI